MQKINIVKLSKLTIFLWTSIFFTTACADQKMDGASSMPDTPAGKLQTRIEKEGADLVLKDLYSNDDVWAETLAMIATGDQQWLVIANKLRSVSDSGASTQLANAVGEALSFSPINVLEISTERFSLDEICSGPDVDDTRFDSYELSSQEIDKRIAMLGQVGGEELASKVNKCVDLLKQSRKHIAEFYGEEIESKPTD